MITFSTSPVYAKNIPPRAFSKSRITAFEQCCVHDNTHVVAVLHTTPVLIQNSVLTKVDMAHTYSAFVAQTQPLLADAAQCRHVTKTIKEARYGLSTQIHNTAFPLISVFSHDKR